MSIVFDIVIGFIIWGTLPGIDPGGSSEWFLDEASEERC